MKSKVLYQKKNKSLDELYNHIRMLDAKTYPVAFIKYGNLKVEFKNAKKIKNKIISNVSIQLNSKK